MRHGYSPNQKADLIGQVVNIIALYNRDISKDGAVFKKNFNEVRFVKNAPF